MAITNKSSGTLSASPTTLAASVSPTNRLVKGIIIVNNDSVQHTVSVTCGEKFIQILLYPGDSMHHTTTVALGSNNLTAVLSEAVVGTNPTYVVSWLDEAETV